MSKIVGPIIGNNEPIHAYTMQWHRELNECINVHDEEKRERLSAQKDLLKK